MGQRRFVATDIRRGKMEGKAEKKMCNKYVFLCVI